MRVCILHFTWCFPLYAIFLNRTKLSVENSGPFTHSVAKAMISQSSPRKKKIDSWARFGGQDSQLRPYEPDLATRIPTHDLVNRTCRPGFTTTNLWTRFTDPDLFESRPLWTRLSDPNSHSQPCKPDLATQIPTHDLVNQTWRPGFQPRPCEPDLLVQICSDTEPYEADMPA